MGVSGMCIWPRCKQDCEEFRRLMLMLFNETSKFILNRKASLSPDHRSAE